ncbi:salicylic acid-binding protein 2 [Phtheirospermum japonicum]|uniref:Salicylic acid-binding protein 2 n=1 Tax=Phtheirospermum japonicum TaxID=374723 RepID=A0A830D6C4_9LAMI|nr:salicylic acid-binding protein 2 [Phtheirospermum japonicum]
MDKNKYHYVLVHGDCHGAWCWYKLATLLKSFSHKVTAIDMASSGMDLKPVQEIRSITDYFEPLMLFMEALPMEETVILVGHSRGGIDISIAMERFPGKIAAAIFVTATMPGPHLDLPTVSKKFDGQLGSPMDNEYTYGQGNDKHPTSYLIGPKFLASRLYQLSPPEDLTLATCLIRPSPLFVDFQKSSKETALTRGNYGSIPRAYVVCDQDNCMKEEMQRWLIDNNPPNEVKVIRGSDHMAMMSKPNDLCSFLLEIGDKYCSG